MTRRPTTERLFTPAFIMLGIAELCYFTAFGVAIFALPLYVTGPIGGDAAGAGLAVGAFALSALVLRPLAGRLADRFGRLPLLFGGALIAAASLALLLLAESLPVVVALRLLAGVAEAAFFVAGFAALADLAPEARMGEALSYNSLGLYLGIAFGPLLGAALVDLAGFGLAWTGAAAARAARRRPDAARRRDPHGGARRRCRAPPDPSPGDPDRAGIPRRTHRDGWIPRVLIAAGDAGRPRQRRPRPVRLRRRRGGLPHRLRARARQGALPRPRHGSPRHDQRRPDHRRKPAIAGRTHHRRGGPRRRRRLQHSRILLGDLRDGDRRRSAAWRRARPAPSSISDWDSDRSRSGSSPTGSESPGRSGWAPLVAGAGAIWTLALARRTAVSSPGRTRRIR